ncbi:MAG: DUF362 domain-containing protein [Candidatus Zhuqueibacterota bacterium]
MLSNLKLNRRKFIQSVGVLLGGLTTAGLEFKVQPGVQKLNLFLKRAKKPCADRTPSHIFVARGRTPEQNIACVIDMMGGIGKIIGKDDIVILKPNAQWRGHGGSNTDAIKGFIDLVLGMAGFRGEIIIAENHHAAEDDSLGWTTTQRNGQFNLNELVRYFNDKGFRNVSKYHWHDAGPNPYPLQFPGGYGKIVAGPDEGDGYVWTNEVYEWEGRRSKMTYPIFTSTYSKKTIDLKHGVWRNRDFTGQPVKLINFSTLNHHSKIFGVTASIKNYLGIVDMTCGVHGTEPVGYYNFHYVGLGWSKDHSVGRFLEANLTRPSMQQFKFMMKAIRYFGPGNGATGGAVGRFMQTIRKADLNIIAAEYVGYEGRLEPPIRTRTVLASIDPVALDYYAAKHVLLPLGGSKAKFNDPDWKEGPFRKFLERCQGEGVGTLCEEDMIVLEESVAV